MLLLLALSAAPASGSTCDAAKLGCLAANQACLLEAHAVAEKAGEPVDIVALSSCGNSLDTSVARLENYPDRVEHSHPRRTL